MSVLTVISDFIFGLMLMVLLTGVSVGLFVLAGSLIENFIYWLKRGVS